MKKLYEPDKWQIVNITKEDTGEVHSKILASFKGGYIGSNSWRVSSPVDSIQDKGVYLKVITSSGSTYKLYKNFIGFDIEISNVYTKMKHISQDIGYKLEVDLKYQKD